MFQGTLYGIFFFSLRQMGLHDARCSEDEAVVPMCPKSSLAGSLGTV